MKGIMFDVLAEVVQADGALPAWDRVLDAAGSTGAYTSLGTYPDQEFVALIVALSAERREPVEDTLRWFGRSALPVLVDRYPAFADGHTSARSFALTLNHVIHPEVRKLHPGADVPDFRSLPRPEPAFALEYRSARALCTLAEGLLLGAGDRFGERLEVGQSECVHRGDDRCILEVGPADRADG